MPTILKSPARGEPAASDIQPDQSGLNLYGDRCFHPQDLGEGQKQQQQKTTKKNKQLQKKNGKKYTYLIYVQAGRTTGAQNI